MLEKKPIVVLPFTFKTFFLHLFLKISFPFPFVSRWFQKTPPLSKLYVWIHFWSKNKCNPLNLTTDISVSILTSLVIQIKWLINDLCVELILSYFLVEFQRQRAVDLAGSIFFKNPACYLVPSLWGNRTVSWNQKSWKICVRIRNSLVHFFVFVIQCNLLLSICVILFNYSCHEYFISKLSIWLLFLFLWK